MRGRHVKRQIPLQEWMVAQDTVSVFKAFAEKGYQLYFVGGCVRDAVVKTYPKNYDANFVTYDIDLATNAEPTHVERLLRKNGIRVSTKGIEHGTVTAIPDNRPFQITTLRRDVKTDGRHAKVLYTNDWEGDANRRDFTINALYADLSGNVYDFVNGLDDLREGKIKFIGSPSDRIAEDCLRILRYFRFQAHYGRTKADAMTINACKGACGALVRLSSERIWKEFSNILTAPRPAETFTIMEKIGLIKTLFAQRFSIKHLISLSNLESYSSCSPDPIRRLVSLFNPDKNTMPKISKLLRLSKEEALRLAFLSETVGLTHPDMDTLSLQKILYKTGPNKFRDRVLLDWVNYLQEQNCEVVSDFLGLKVALGVAENWVEPKLPISGFDLVAEGVSEGKTVGLLLREVENWWVEQSFPNRGMCIEKLRSLIRERHKE